ncbi:hypothetical protein OHS81_29930 [Streptomyces sp. NBC_00400]|uniref:hypothetical protein n=1 Tax=Streptomyces sp. NBC_00400 TaxID=2975737 RepID=UPI002E1BD619
MLTSLPATSDNDRIFMRSLCPRTHLKKSAIAATTNALFNNKWCANVNANSGGHTVLWNEPLSFAAAKGGRC